MTEQYMITDANDIYLYFDWIEKSKPTSVLDFGIFLQKIGAVSRQVMNCELPEDVVLDGVSMQEQIQPIYTVIYNNITNIKSLSILDDKIYDLIYFLDMQNEYREDIVPMPKEELWMWLLNHGKTIVTDTKDANFVAFMLNHTTCQAICLKDKQYPLIEGKAIIQNEKVVLNEKKVLLNTEQMNVQIYIAAHKKFVIPDEIDFEEGMYIPLHVGKAGKPSLGFIGDDTGDNISAKNDTYCELTGIYWIWKNIQCDIVGLCHYRRYFFSNGKILNKDDVCKLMSQYDIIIGNSGMSSYGSVKNHYMAYHNWNDMLVCKDVIKKQCPEYIQAFEQCMNSNFMNIANMMICKKNVFDAYCEWLFGILEEVEKRTDVSYYDTYQKRLYGFLAERLLRVWLINSKLNVRELQIYLCEEHS